MVFLRELPRKLFLVSLYDEFFQPWLKARVVKLLSEMIASTDDLADWKMRKSKRKGKEKDAKAQREMTTWREK